jgi:hypothetical protein
MQVAGTELWADEASKHYSQGCVVGTATAREVQGTCVCCSEQYTKLTGSQLEAKQVAASIDLC